MCARYYAAAFLVLGLKKNEEKAILCEKNAYCELG